MHRLLDHADEPPADVFWADDPIRPYVLVQRGLIEPYRSPQAVGIPAAFKDEKGLWTGVGGQARVLLVNTKLVPTSKRPTSIKSFADPHWKGRTAIANPVHGSTAAHMGALDAQWGDDDMHRFIDAMRANEVRIATTSWDVKRIVEKGDAAFGLTNTDHASEAMAAGSAVAVVYPDQEKDGLGTLVLPTSVLLIHGGPHPEAARRLVDHHYAQDQLGDIVFVDMPAPGTAVTALQKFGEIESVKAVSELFAPVSGEVVERNEGLEDSPQSVNDDPYGEGWMIRVRLSNPGEVDALLSADQYEEFLQTAAE